MNAVLVRHTRLEGNVGICYGRFDFPLAKTFEAEARGVALRLPFVPALLWSSPSERCVKLATWLAKGRGVRTDPRLAEMSFGEWEGRAWDELRGPAVEAWMDDPWQARPPGGETVPEFVERVRAFRDELTASDADRAVIVTHAGVIRCWRSLAEQRPLPELFHEQVDYGQLVAAS